MVCHRWTLALIIFAVALLVTVISAFRVRLPGTSHEVKSDLRKHKCKDCDVDDLNLDPITHSLKKESAKRSYDGIKKILKDKRHLIEEKLSKTSFDHYNISEDEFEVDDTNVSEDDLKESTLKSVELSSNLHGKTRNKKASVILDFDDDDDSDIEEDDEYDDINQKSSKKSSSAENKKKIESIEDLYNDVRPITKSKAIVKEETDKKIYDKELREIKVESKLQSKKKVDILAPKEILKESPTSKDELLKPLKREIKGDIHKEEVKKSFKSSDPIKPTSIEKTKDASSKESSILKPQADKLGLKVKEDTILVDNEKIISKKADVKIPAQKVKEDNIEIKPKISEKREEKAEIKEKIKIAIENKKTKIFDELKVDSQQSVRTSDSKEARAQQLPEALVRRNLLQSEFEDFYAFFPTFAPNFSRIHNPECRRHGQILLRQLRGTKLWALNMLDATAKIPSGLLQGNAIQLGDFDQCLGVRARVQLDTGSIVKIQGKYCLAMVDVKAEHPDLEAPVHLAQARNVFKSRIDDPGHFVPRFSTLSWGVCVPATCGPEDVEVVLRDAIKHYQYKTGISVRVKVDEMDCHVRTGPNWWKDWMEMRTILTLSLYAIVVILVLLATLQDYLARNSSEDTGDKGDEVEESEKKENEAATKEKQSSGKSIDEILYIIQLLVLLYNILSTTRIHPR